MHPGPGIRESLGTCHPEHRCDDELHPERHRHGAEYQVPEDQREETVDFVFKPCKVFSRHVYVHRAVHIAEVFNSRP